MEIRPATTVPHAVWARSKGALHWYLMHKTEEGLVGEYLLSPRGSTYTTMYFGCGGEPDQATLKQMQHQEVRYMMGEEPWR